MRHHYEYSTWINGCLCSKYDFYTALIAKFFGMNYFLAISLFPKSVPTRYGCRFRKMQDYDHNLGCSCYYGYLNCLRSCLS